MALYEASATTTTGTSSSSTKPNVGAIAGGVIGGLLVVAALTYLVWRFCIKNKRQQYEQESWVEDQEESTQAEKDFAMRRDARASTHTVASIASTVLTRASNIIQIAYIPGVTNRSAPSTPGLLVPPVPPIPIALSSAGSTPTYEQEHFFMPGDLRDSTYSGISDRTSYARTSVASTIYGKNAIVSPVPAQTVIRGKAAVVSVKSTGPSTPGDVTPPVPNIDYNKYTAGGPPSPAFSVGSTFLNSASAATQMKPQLIRVANGSKKSTEDFSSENESSPRDRLLPRDSQATTIHVDDTPTVEQGPFSDPPRMPRASNGTLGTMAKEGSKKSQGSGQKKEKTPFGDENEMPVYISFKPPTTRHLLREASRGPNPHFEACLIPDPKPIMAGKMVLYKIVVLGDGGVGKTALTIQLTLQHFVETYDPTIEDSYRKQVVIDGQSCMLEVLDTAGQEEYTALRDQWIRDGEGFVLVYSISSRSSFTRIQRFHNQIQRVKESASSPSYSGSPISPISPSIGPPPIMLVGNKSDRVTEREVSTQEGSALARELGCDFVEASAKNCVNVEKAFYDVVLEKEPAFPQETGTPKNRVTQVAPTGLIENPDIFLPITLPESHFTTFSTSPFLFIRLYRKPVEQRPIVGGVRVLTVDRGPWTVSSAAPHSHPPHGPPTPTPTPTPTARGAKEEAKDVWRIHRPG
ncbi:hypothetical protein B7494_g6680 [Chlorociboria aeruginascens]|nr:hypothetical protein B7494_g6680 [Chlorociboria aeruginascens]